MSWWFWFLAGIGIAALMVWAIIIYMFWNVRWRVK
jgi:hypothetical protein